MNSTKKAARRAGLLYLVMSLPAPFTLIYIPSFFMSSGDPAAVANTIRTSEFLFRFGIVGALVGWTLFIFVGLALYDLFKGVDKKLALLMLVLVLVSVPISYLNELNRIAALVLLSGADFLSAFDPHHLNAMVLVFLKLYGKGILIVETFWGLWLFPFGALVYRSGFLPRILGVLLIPAGCAYLAVVFTYLLFPHYGDMVSKVASVLQFGELPIILWLSIMGAKDQPLDAPA
ncbi:MAG TPA: DUF4386 domain-containing protein [Candidatus Dormibacteraeota bacterium]|nr:DUF4386 domain-containing protein [Candidatus Dormibacteraeota bacterium]